MTTIDGIEFTDQTPTVHGPYLWTHNEHSRPSPWWIGPDFYPEHDPAPSGYWCRLVPASAIEAAFKEGYRAAFASILRDPPELIVEVAWERSNARHGVEGGV